jgi:SAM-dependent methyltransferase
MKDEKVAARWAQTSEASYEQIAPEYYDPRHHPTCANFREASAVILRGWLGRFPARRGLICEAGAGKSLAAELLAEQAPAALPRLLITDASPSMLDYSSGWEAKGARLAICEASDLPVEDGEVALLISSLGDPYNEPAFWAEARRGLAPGGRCFYTTPSHEWASAFRSSAAGEEALAAAFDLSGDGRVHVPSWIYPEGEQRGLIEGHGLAVDEVWDVRLPELKSGPISPKLRLEGRPGLSVVTGYLVSKSA